jgi:hypothetical protein
LERPKQTKTDMRFGARSVRSLHREGSLTTVGREIAKYKLNLVGVQRVELDRGGNEPAGN